MKTIPLLPQELIDIVVDYLHDDSSSLRRCAQAHRTFLPAARYHLFSSLTIVGRYTGLGDGLWKPSLMVLASRRRIYRLVRQLTITTMPDGSSPPSINVNIVSSILALLPNIRALRLKRLQLESPLIPLPQTFPHLDSLILEDLHAHGAHHQELFHLICLFRSISLLRTGSLGLKNNDIPRAPFQFVDCAIPQAEIHALHGTSRGASLRFILYGLMTILKHESGALRSVDINCDSWETAEAIGGLLQLTGSSITRLSLNTHDILGRYDTVVTTYSWRVLNLHNCTSLDSVHLFLLPSYPLNGFPHISPVVASRIAIACNSVLDILREIPTTSLRHINLMVVAPQETVEKYEKVAILPWDDLDRWFEQCPSRALEEVTIDSGVVLGGPTLDFMRQRLPLTSARVKVEVNRSL